MKDFNEFTSQLDEGMKLPKWDIFNPNWLKSMMKDKEAAKGDLKKSIALYDKMIAKAGKLTKGILQSDRDNLTKLLDVVMSESLEEAEKVWKELYLNEATKHMVSKSKKVTVKVAGQGDIVSLYWNPKMKEWGYTTSKGLTSGYKDKEKMRMAAKQIANKKAVDDAIKFIEQGHVTEEVTKLKKGQKVKVDSKGDDYHGQTGVVYRVDNKKQGATVKMKDGSINSFGFDELTEAVQKKGEYEEITLKNTTNLDITQYHSKRKFLQSALGSRIKGNLKDSDWELVGYGASDKKPQSITVRVKKSRLNEEVVGTGAIPQGPESIGVKTSKTVEPDAQFRGMGVFKCDNGTFTNCMQGKKKYGRWAVYLGRQNELVGRVQQWMSQSAKNQNFILQNNSTGEMVVARRQSK